MSRPPQQEQAFSAMCRFCKHECLCLPFRCVDITATMAGLERVLCACQFVTRLHVDIVHFRQAVTCAPFAVASAICTTNVKAAQQQLVLAFRRQSLVFM